MGWYQEGSIVDAFRGGEAETGLGSGVDNFINGIISDWRKGAIKEDVAKGGGATDAFGDIKSGTNILFGITDEERIKGQGALLNTTYGTQAGKYDFSLTNPDGTNKSKQEIEDFLGGRKEVQKVLDSSGFSAAELGFDPKTGSMSQLGSLIRTKKETESCRVAGT